MTTVEKSTGFGSYLRNQRRAMGISIETVSQKTKIRVEVLRHLENEDLGRLPSSAFLKGFVRAYAEAVGADSQEALRLFAATCTAHAQCDMAAAPTKDRTPFWRGFLLACVVLILLIFITLSIARRMEKTPEATLAPEKGRVVTATPAVPVETAAPTPAATGPTPGAQAAGNSTPLPVVPGQPLEAASSPNGETPVSADADANTTSAEPQATRQVRPAKLVLQIAAIELTWLRVTSDGKTSKEITLKPDDRMTFEAERRFDLVIGNAGGVQLALNDQALGFPGKRGKVISMRLP
jgi:cytoskeletal protein RodZ